MYLLLKLVGKWQPTWFKKRCSQPRGCRGKVGDEDARPVRGLDEVDAEPELLRETPVEAGGAVDAERVCRLVDHGAVLQRLRFA